MSNGGIRMVADLWAFEQAVNPDDFWHDGPTAVESNPFDVALLDGGRVLAPNGTLYVLELDEASWLGMEAGGFAKAEGGTLNACNVATGVARWS